VRGFQVGASRKMEESTAGVDHNQFLQQLESAAEADFHTASEYIENVSRGENKG